MNLLVGNIILAGFIYTLLFNSNLLLFYVLVVGFYTFMHYMTKKNAYKGVRRKIQIATWPKIGDPAVLV